jgi:hypothetical protein
MDDIDSSNDTNTEDVATGGAAEWLTMTGKLLVYIGIACALYVLCSISERRRMSRRLRNAEESFRRISAANRLVPTNRYVLPHHRKIKIRNALVIRTVKALNKGGEKGKEKASNPKSADILTTKRAAASDSISNSLSLAELTIDFGGSSSESLPWSDEEESQSSSLNRKEEEVEGQSKSEQSEASSRSGEERYVFLVRRGNNSDIAPLSSVQDDDDKTEFGPEETANQPPQLSCPIGNDDSSCDYGDEGGNIEETEQTNIEHPCVLAKPVPNSYDLCSVGSMGPVGNGFLILDDDEEDEALIHKSQRNVDALCSICLVCYEDGDRLAWSKNPSCAHVFHEDCIVPWLMKHEDCPNCRCNYFEFEGSD